MKPKHKLVSVVVLAMLTTFSTSAAAFSKGNQNSCRVPIVAQFSNAPGDAITSSSSHPGQVDCGDVQFVLLFSTPVSYAIPTTISSTGSLGVIVAGGLEQMGDGSIMDAEKTQFAYSDGTYKYWLDFGTRAGGNGTVALNVETTATGNRRVWTITGSVAEVRRCAAKGKCNVESLGLASSPFTLTLTEQN